MPRKKPLKAPFVVTVSAAAAATFALACGGKAIGVDDGMTSNPPGPNPTSEVSSNPPPPPERKPACPGAEVVPESGCSVNGVRCSYVDTCVDRPFGSSAQKNYECANYVWVRRDEPYQAACPKDMPQHGDSCATCAGTYPSSCAYPENTGSGCPAPLVECDPKTLTWKVMATSCNPPPPDAGGGGP